MQKVIKILILRRGYQTLDSNNALAYLRYSDPKHDTFTRVQRQERFLKLWVEQEHNAFFLTNAWHIWRIWDRFDSNISTLDAIKLVYNASKINKEEIHFTFFLAKRVSRRYDLLEGKSNRSTTFSGHYNGQFTG